MLDWYTKFLLTVIALALTTIAVQGPLVGQASAQFRQECGAMPQTPCYLKFPPQFGMASGDLRIEITNWPMR